MTVKNAKNINKYLSISEIEFKSILNDLEKLNMIQIIDKKYKITNEGIEAINFIQKKSTKKVKKFDFSQPIYYLILEVENPSSVWA